MLSIGPVSPIVGIDNVAVDSEFVLGMLLVELCLRTAVHGFSCHIRLFVAHVNLVMYYLVIKI